MSLIIRLAIIVSVALYKANLRLNNYYIEISCSYLFRVDKVLIAKLISCAKIGSCVGAVTFTSAFAMLLVVIIFSASFNSFNDKVRFMA